MCIGRNNMTPKGIADVYRVLQEQLLQKSVLKKMKLTKKRMLELLKGSGFQQRLGPALAEKLINCGKTLELCQGIMEELSGSTPESGWLPYIYSYVRKGLFPGSCPDILLPEY